MDGWKREIIGPVDRLLHPRYLVWKEKYGTIRIEWIRDPKTGELSSPNGIDTILEEASKRCCAECGRWHEWKRGNDTAFARVSNRCVRGWWLTLCDACFAKTGEVDDAVQEQGAAAVDVREGSQDGASVGEGNAQHG